MMALKYRVIIKKDPEEGVYIASVPTLPGCNTFGNSVEEAVEMAKEAIEAYIETLQDLGKEIPPSPLKNLQRLWRRMGLL
jgi:antitoxin HicB